MKIAHKVRWSSQGYQDIEQAKEKLNKKITWNKLYFNHL